MTEASWETYSLPIPPPPPTPSKHIHAQSCQKQPDNFDEIFKSKQSKFGEKIWRENVIQNITNNSPSNIL